MKPFIIPTLVVLGGFAVFVGPSFTWDVKLGKPERGHPDPAIRELFEIPKESKAAWERGEADFKAHFEALPKDRQKSSALAAVQKGFSDSPAVFAGLIEEVRNDGARNSLWEKLLSELARHRSPEEAVDFVINEVKFGPRRERCLQMLYRKWFVNSPEDAIRDAGRLVFGQDLDAFERVLVNRANRVTRHECDLAVEARLADRLQRKFVGIYVDKIRQQHGREIAKEMLDSDPLLESLVSQ